MISFLATGTKMDLKTHRIPNKLTGTIALLCIPLIIINIYLNGSLFLMNIIIAAGFLILFYAVENFGGADTKVFIPLTLSFSLIELMIFSTVMLIYIAYLVIVMKYKWNAVIPFFPGIFLGATTCLFFSTTMVI
jgi:Flp pilus assembly protein protease CpaA